MNRKPSHSPQASDEDVDVPVIARMAGVLVVILIVCCVVSAAYFFMLAGIAEHQEGPILSPLPRTEMVFPRPRIQADPKEDFRLYQQEMERRLTEYRWIDRQKGIVAIPIDRAMELILERGLPHGREAAQGADAPTWLEMLQSRGVIKKEVQP